MPGNIDLSQMQDPLGLLRLGYAKPLLKLQATRWRDGQPSDSAETIAEEIPVAIVYNGIPHVVMMATPQDLEDFVLGFSITEELIRSPADLEGLEVVRYSRGIEIKATVNPECAEVIAGKTRRLTGRTGCGICGADSVAMVLKELHRVEGDKVVVRAHSVPTPLAAVLAPRRRNAQVLPGEGRGGERPEAGNKNACGGGRSYRTRDKLAGALHRTGANRTRRPV